ncbi:MAG TPA: PRC-barrel domain-containing protein [Oligoflexus sp.]|uniref:PRC-barrel domain-containing protein n=1 Tax=Oligoflexus sp. TaxID=1971216 RepID=UPI002D80F29D|nr:PRC-barrel domain-containing protein [Oligoflexus sp.]HET9236644.1 PRC-barrel domain-containing protein [Oligoflexus sp.]
MLYRADGLKGSEIRTRDGASGSIEDLYFDDVSWTVRYLVVDTGSWFSGKRVLISPQAMRGVEREGGPLTLDLTEQQIKDSPAWDSETTVSRYHEERLSQYYGWAPYWVTPAGVYPWAGIYTYPPFPAGTPEVQERISGAQGSYANDLRPGSVDRSQDIHLRSFKEVKGYGLRATDGDIGELDDLLIDASSWRITHLVADSRKWWPGGQVLVDRGMVEDISWSEHKIVVGMTKDEVKQAPAYDSQMKMDDAFLSRLANYYQRIAAHRHTLRSPGPSASGMMGSEDRSLRNPPSDFLYAK